MKISADSIKASVAAYWRYIRQCPLVALEASCLLESFNYGGQADILIVTEARYLIEVEVKLTMGDLRRDKNKLKHRSFRDNLVEYPTRFFYFAVPKKLANKTVLVCGQLYPYAGVIGSDGQGEAEVVIYREPKALWGGKLSFPQILRMAREQSATICRLARILAEVKSKRPYTNTR